MESNRYSSRVIPLLLALSAAVVHAESRNLTFAKEAIAKAEANYAKAVAFMKQHPTREDLPGQPIAQAFRDLNRAEDKLERAEKKGEPTGDLRETIESLREAYAKTYFEFVAPLILERAREGKERYVWSAVGTVRDIEKHVASGPSAELSEQAKRILASGGEAEVRRYLDEARRRLERGDFQRARHEAQTAARLAKTAALHEEATTLKASIERAEGEAREQKRAAKEHAAQGYDLLEAGKFREAAELFGADPRGFRLELAQCKVLEELAEIGDVHAACTALRAAWKKALTWEKRSHWVNRYQHLPAYGLKRVAAARESTPDDPALVFEAALLHFTYENYPTVKQLLDEVHAANPQFADARGTPLAEYRAAIDAILANASAHSEYRSARSQARKRHEQERLDLRYAPVFNAWKRGVDVFLRAF